MRKIAAVLLMMTAGWPHGKTAVTLGARGDTAQGISGTGVLLIDSPFFLLADANRKPLAGLPVGTVVKVLEKEAAPSSTAPAPGTSAAPDQAARPADAPAPRSPEPLPQKPSSWSERGYISVNGAYQATSNAFTGATTFTQNVEPASVTTTYGGFHPPVFDVGGAARVWRNLAVGAALTWSSGAADATLSASIPHPFLFNAPRMVTGTVMDVPRRELALHMNASWVVPTGRRARIAIFGGPSYFQLRQGLVTDVSASSTYPYDTATFVGATIVQTSQSQLGYNAGLDIAARVSEYFGVGAIVRYSRASVEFPSASGPGVTVRAGGLQVGAGVRFSF